MLSVALTGIFNHVGPELMKEPDKGISIMPCVWNKELQPPSSSRVVQGD